MKYLVIAFLACFSLLAWSHQKELKIATFIEPPFVDLVKGELAGEHVDISKLLAKSLNFKPVFVQCPFARCLSLVKSGQADMILGLIKNTSREKDLYFLNPPYMVQQYPLRFYTLSSKKIVINNFDDLQYLSIGTLRGANYFDDFDKDDTLNKVELTSREQLVNMLLRGRIDTFIEREESILPLLPLEDYSTKFTLAPYQYTKAVNSYIAISRHSEISKHGPELSAELNKLIENGTIQTIRNKRLVE